MKTCPVCRARCFDDMEVCYGCLHRFGIDDCGGSDVFSHVEDEIVEPKERIAGPRQADDVESSGRITATVHPSRGMHGAMVVKIEIPASLLRSADADRAIGVVGG